MYNDQPFWAFIYYLFRCGEIQKALEWARKHQTFLDRNDRHFLAYLAAYVESEDHRLPKVMRAQILTDFNQRSRSRDVDPFKLAVYKIIGRCDLAKKTIPEVIQATEDYVWFQLLLVRETMDIDDPTYERYTLRDLQQLLLRFGADHFNPKGMNPFNYFQVLLQSAQFERVVTITSW